MAKLNNVEIHFKHSNRTYNTMTAFLVMLIPTSVLNFNLFIILVIVKVYTCVLHITRCIVCTFNLVVFGGIKY